MLQSTLMRSITSCLGLGLLSLALLLSAFDGLTKAEAQGPPQTSPPSQKPAPEQTDAAAKALARKQRFEELKRRLEEEGSNPSAGAKDSSQTLFISPAQVGMLVNDEQGFSVFDIQGDDMTAKAEWSLSNSYVADLIQGPIPRIRAKDHGTVTVRARIGSQDAKAEVEVFSGDKLRPGTVRWKAPAIPGYHSKQYAQAPPTVGGPDIYVIEESEDGKTTLVRALFIDGRQKWMRRTEGKVDQVTPPFILQRPPV
jgi:hypothetical protein